MLRSVGHSHRYDVPIPVRTGMYAAQTHGLGQRNHDLAVLGIVAEHQHVGLDRLVVLQLVRGDGMKCGGHTYSGSEPLLCFQRRRLLGG